MSDLSNSTVLAAQQGDQAACAAVVEPRNALTRQYVALLKTENVELSFTQKGLERLPAPDAFSGRPAG